MSSSATPTQNRPAPADSHGLFRRLWPWAFVAAAACPLVFGWCGRWLWGAELVTHFRVQATAFALGCCLIPPVARRWRPSAAGVAVTVLLAAGLVPFLPPRARQGLEKLDADGLTTASEAL